ncbi:MAG: DUF5050 domain-containing protein [Oscillospiraceae bacterium]|nr:DUF5050 domain-containing protein [Oscillospiraceae bacterium]
MIKKIILLTVILNLSIIFFSCLKTNTNNQKNLNSITYTDSTNEISPIKDTAEKSKDFKGLEHKIANTRIFGNTISCLNQEGLIYVENNVLIYSNDNGDLIYRTKEIQETLIKEANAKYINFINDTIYYINSKNNNAYSYNLSDKTTEIIYSDINSLIATSDFIVYKDINNNLYIQNQNENELISKNIVLWTEFYDEYIIFTELKNDCCIKAYNINTKETIELLEYGLSPFVYEDDLYYQNKDGYIYTLNLPTGKNILIYEDWGQQFCILNDELYYLSSKGICCEGNIINSSTDLSQIERIFICNNNLYFLEQKDGISNIYFFDAYTKKEELIK